MQLVYLDEAGISNRAQEPYLVVVGAIVDADGKWKALESHFQKLTKKYLGDESGKHIFHMTEIWHGSRTYDREKWGSKRWELLTELAEIPVKFSIPIVAGFINRADARSYYKATVNGVDEQRIHVWTHMEAFHRCIRRAENWMQKNCTSENEVAMLIAEDTDKVKGVIRMIHDGYTDRTIPRYDSAFQSNHIVDDVHFVKKERSIVLQVADHCAFLVKRHLMKRADSEPLFKLIQPQLFLQPTKGEGILVSIPVEHVRPVDPNIEWPPKS